MASRLVFFFLSLFPLLFVPAYACEFVVVRVVDGDTLTVAPKNAVPQQAIMGVRLYGIDAPEMKQPDGEASRAALEALVNPGDVVSITHMGMDRYARIVGLVALQDGRILNYEQVRNGYAWVYERYCRARFCRDWKNAETEADAQKRGIWARE